MECIFKDLWLNMERKSKLVETLLALTVEIILECQVFPLVLKEASVEQAQVK